MNRGIHQATADEIEELAPIVEQATGKDLDVLYRWMTERSDSGNAASPGFVIEKMNEKLLK